jgi:hypothetical protein
MPAKPKRIANAVRKRGIRVFLRSGSSRRCQGMVRFTSLEHIILTRAVRHDKQRRCPRRTRRRETATVHGTYGNAVSPRNCCRSVVTIARARGCGPRGVSSLTLSVIATAANTQPKTSFLGRLNERELMRK